MSARKNPSDLGPDLLARYLAEYAQSRQMSDMERPWGFDDDGLDAVWTRLVNALSTDARQLDQIVASELNDAERARVIESLAPLIFALPLRIYPAELRVFTESDRLVFVLSHADDLEGVGFLPAALAPAFIEFLRRVLHLRSTQRRKESVISSLGRRRQVSVTLHAGRVSASIRFLGRLPSHGEEP